MNNALAEEVFKEEMNHILHSFQKGQSLGHDGCTVEFFIGFYEMLKDDLLKVVQES